MNRLILAALIVGLLTLPIAAFASPSHIKTQPEESLSALDQTAPWFAGVQTTQNAMSNEVDAMFYVSDIPPMAGSVYFPLMLSVYDDNSSYDQLGYVASVGTWQLANSYTYYSGNKTVYMYEDDAMALPPGYYWFRMNISGGSLTYTLLGESGHDVLWSKTVRTGGSSFFISPIFMNVYTGQVALGYSIFEEIYGSSLDVPRSNFYSPESYYVSGGVRFENDWTVCKAGAVPEEIAVNISASSVIIQNAQPSVSISTVRSSYYTKEPIMVSAKATGFISSPTFRWTLNDTHQAETGQNFSLSFAQPGWGSVSAVASDNLSSATSQSITLAVSKVSLDLETKFGRVSGGGSYDYGDVVAVGLEPSSVLLEPGHRMTFEGWRSDSPDGYSGNATAYSLTLHGNITEVASWQEEFLVVVSSHPSGFSWSGWQAAGQGQISLPATWSDTGSSRVSLVGCAVNGVALGVNRTDSAQLIPYDIQAPLNIQLGGVLQYHVSLAGYPGTAVTNSPTGDLWFDAGTEASVTIPAIDTEGVSRYIFLGWKDGGTAGTLNIPDIASNATLQPTWRTQFYVMIGCSSQESPLAVNLTGAPFPGAKFSGPSSIGGLWLDEGALFPYPLELLQQSATTQSRLRLYYVGVGTASTTQYSMVRYQNGTVGYVITSTDYIVQANLVWRYAVSGSSILQASGSVQSIFSNLYSPFLGLSPNPEGAPPPEIVNGTIVVDYPMYVYYAYAPELHVSVSTPYGGFDGWVLSAQGTGEPYTYPAPPYGGFLGTQKFMRWEGTVNSTSPTLNALLVQPLEETAVYQTDFVGVAVLVVAALGTPVAIILVKKSRPRLSARLETILSPSLGINVGRRTLLTGLAATGVVAVLLFVSFAPVVQFQRTVYLPDFTNLTVSQGTPYPQKQEVQVGFGSLAYRLFGLGFPPAFNSSYPVDIAGQRLTVVIRDPSMPDLVTSFGWGGRVPIRLEKLTFVQNATMAIVSLNVTAVVENLDSSQGLTVRLYLLTPQAGYMLGNQTTIPAGGKATLGWTASTSQPVAQGQYCEVQISGGSSDGTSAFNYVAFVKASG